jgi:hypothetical protein
MTWDGTLSMLNWLHRTTAVTGLEALTQHYSCAVWLACQGLSPCAEPCDEAQSEKTKRRGMEVWECLGKPGLMTKKLQLQVHQK